jgi:uncharacterized membrane protein YoaK (UPF0700 family)
VWQLAWLAAVAGCVDALSLTTAGVFTANMTGNTIVLAVAVVRGESRHVLLAAISLAGYVASVAFGARMGARRPHLILATEFAVAAGYAVAWYIDAGSIGTWLLVAIAAVMMGLQSAWLNASGVHDVSTTYMTGTWTGFIFDYAATAMGSVDRARASVIAAFFGGAVIAALLAGRFHAAAGSLPLVLLVVATFARRGGQP